jgi:hypothetical protein
MTPENTDLLNAKLATTVVLLERIKQLYADIPSVDELTEISDVAAMVASRLEAVKAAWMDSDMPTLDELKEYEEAAE